MCRAKAGDNFLKTVSFTHPDSIDESRARLCLSTLIHLFDLLVSAQIKYGALSGRPREKMKKMNFLVWRSATKMAPSPISSFSASTLCGA